MNNEIEIWKAIPGYEGFYEVSNLGNFRSLDRLVPSKWGGMRFYPGKALLKEQALDGYQRIVLMKNGVKKRWMCHTLVALSFIPNPTNKPFVNHKDGIRNNNTVDNLEWCSREENELHKFRVLKNSMKGKTCPKAIVCETNGKIFASMSKAVEYIGDNSCVEGLKKAIDAKRPYHGAIYNYL